MYLIYPSIHLAIFPSIRLCFCHRFDWCILSIHQFICAISPSIRLCFCHRFDWSKGRSDVKQTLVGVFSHQFTNKILFHVLCYKRMFLHFYLNFLEIQFPRHNYYFLYGCVKGKLIIIKGVIFGKTK